MKLAIVFSLNLLLASMHTQDVSAYPSTNPRVIAMTDGEIDDRCSMIRFLLYTNDMDVLAIIQTNSVYQGEGWSSSNWLDQQLDAYEQVYPNLIVHDSSYPSPDELRNKVYVGDEDPDHLMVDSNSRKRFPGMEPVIDPSDWPDTPGSDRIVEILREDDSRPVYIQAWGGGNTAAKAFDKLKSQYPEDYTRAISKVVMYNIWYQDGAGSYIEQHHPDVTMLLSHYFSGTWDYTSQAFTQNFVEDDVKSNHGPLGALYPQGYISEGDSPAFLYTLANGLRSYENPTFGGWGGRFHKVEGFENVYRDIDKGSYRRWVEYANRDFKTRLDWCVAENFEDANHKPIIAISGGLDRTVRSGETVELEAVITDRDSVDADALWPLYAELQEQAGRDKATFTEIVKTWPKASSLWWQYREAGTYDGMVTIADPIASKTQFVSPTVDEPTTIHLILEATDRGNPRLTTFARVIITVEP